MEKTESKENKMEAAAPTLEAQPKKESTHSVQAPVKEAAPAKATVEAPAKEAKAQKAAAKELKKENLYPLDHLRKVFGKWDSKDVVVNDISLVKHISLDMHVFPDSFGRLNKRKFQKEKISVVERLINKIMRSGQGKRKLSGKFIRGRNSTGKKLQAMKIVSDAFEIVEQKTKQNPVQALVKAIENSAPREDITRLKKGGVAYTQAVDLSPLKRIDEAIKNLALAGFAGSFNSKQSAADALASEIILAAKEDSNSFSVKRRNEIERIAVSSR